MRPVGASQSLQALTPSAQLLCFARFRPPNHTETSALTHYLQLSLRIRREGSDYLVGLGVCVLACGAKGARLLACVGWWLLHCLTKEGEAQSKSCNLQSNMISACAQLQAMHQHYWIMTPKTPGSHVATPPKFHPSPIIALHRLAALPCVQACDTAKA